MFKYAKEVNECLREIQKGDKTKIDELYNITANHIRYIAWRSLTNKIYADDVVADTFIKLYKYIDSYDCSKDGYRWMYSIAKKIAFSYNEKVSKTMQLEKQFTRENQRLDYEEDFCKSDFFTAISDLDEMDREIAIMRFYFDHTMQYIGNRFNISRVAVFQRIRKICNIIGEKLKNK